MVNDMIEQDLPALTNEHKQYALTGLAKCGLTFADCLYFFSQEQLNDPDLVILAEIAKREFEEEGELEFDDNPIVSKSSAPSDPNAEKGAYVMAWVWVSEEGAA